VGFEHRISRRDWSRRSLVSRLLVTGALDLSHAQLQDSYHVLATRGNVGTPSIFYVLNETLRRRPGHGQRGLMVTVGPGITVGLMLLEF
jgi:predicted naringenin-chalcone synthase